MFAVLEVVPNCQYIFSMKASLSVVVLAGLVLVVDDDVVAEDDVVEDLESMAMQKSA